MKVAIALLLLAPQAKSEVAVVPFIGQCPPAQVFDSAGLICKDCEPSTCGCSSNSLQTNAECSIESLWQGTCIDLSCSSDCSPLSQVPSLDKQRCIPCSGSADQNSTLYESSQFDLASETCKCDNPPKGISTRAPVVTKKLVEVYDDSGLPIRVDCLRCPQGSAVITTDLYESGQDYFVTAGRRYTADPYTCVYCPDVNMFFDTDYSCICNEGYLLIGEPSLGEQSCIKHSPSVSSNPKVRFLDPVILETESSEAYDFSLESIVFSHVYPKAASECEYHRGSSNQPCQALANLCVMSMYDDEAPACKQLETISQRRVETYHSQEEWKHTLPWILYANDGDYITNDRGIQMKVSFHPEENRVDTLTFKLAKFTVGGLFLGFEDLTHQFEFCAEMRDHGKPRWLAFGNTYRHEYTCDLGELMSQEMFLYDLYIVDESAEACTSSDLELVDCLYPVPVLNRNLIKDNKFVNVNQLLDDELDDIYTRRFFLFDNLSGLTSSGIEAIRYAKKIVLQVPTQASAPTSLLPPVLTIEYATATSADWNNSTTLVFKAEYSMKSETFWADIQVMIGFIAALAVVIFGIRMNNWLNRQRAGSEDPSSSSSILGLHFMLHAFVVICHTFVLLFFFFQFMICGYWFLFFKLQNEVFLLLPAENEFYGVTSEYFFFEAAFRLLFWCQTIYVIYIIARQCNTDIMFIDWERPPKRGSKPSMWRLVMVANEFARLQSKRRSSMEFSLIVVAFFMVGLSQENNALPQPNFYYQQEGKANIALAFANAVIFWSLAWTVQWLWRYIIFERYLDEPPSQKLIDLCSVSNISLFAMLENNKGYYIHGKSPYNTTDCSMEELVNNLKREGAGGRAMERGLSEATGLSQSFDFFASPAWRHQISKIYSVAAPEQAGTFVRKDTNGDDSDKTALAREELTTFLQCFIDQNPTASRDGLRYICREPLLLERLLCSTPAEFRTNEDPKSVLHPDNEGFLTTTMIGIEFDLLLHDILTYNVTYMSFNNVGISIFLTYVLHLLRTSVRAWLGTRNLSKKSFIDSRFLGR